MARLGSTRAMAYLMPEIKPSVRPNSKQEWKNGSTQIKGQEESQEASSRQFA
jgi:hypothetical protein